MSDDGIGYHTPDVEKFSGNVQSRIVTLPLSLWYLVNGALEELSFEQSWVQFGTATPEETAAFFLDALDELRVHNMIGSVIPFFTDTLPDGVLPCNGGTYSGDDYPKLFDVMPNAYRVGKSDFFTPNLQGKFLRQFNHIDAVGDTGGYAEVTLSVENLPPHTHNYNEPVPNVDIEAPGAPDLLAAGVGPSTQTTETGNADPFPILPPYMAVKYGIVAR